MNIIRKIDETVLKYNMLSSGDSVAVGVSGGKDSMLLLYYLLKKKKELGLKLTVLNVEHGIRGEASVNDTEFVRDYCEKAGVPFKCLRIDAPAEAKAEGMGVEEYSRKRRYGFFESEGADKIATAHSLSDNVETVLFRLARGTSLNGFKGIPPVRENIIRPLIECTSEEIVCACEELNIPYVTDETNSDNVYARNKIRNEIIPLFESVNHAAEKSIARFISSAAEDNDFIAKEAEKYLSDTLSVSQLKTLHSSVLKRVIELYAESFNVVLDETHLNSVCALLDSYGKTQIKGNLFAFANKDNLYFAEYNDVAPDYLTDSKTVKIDELNNEKDGFGFYCDSDKISGGVFVRSRTDGDEISPAGRGCTKTLKKLFNELRIPVEKRAYVPVICDEKGVIGVYGYAVDERVKIDGNTSSVYFLNINTEDCI